MCSVFWTKHTRSSRLNYCNVYPEVRGQEGNPPSIPADHCLAQMWLRGRINSGRNAGRGTRGIRCFKTFRNRLRLLRRENWGPEPLSLQVTTPEPRTQFFLASLTVDRPLQRVPPVTLGQFRSPPKRLERHCPRLCHSTPTGRWSPGPTRALPSKVSVWEYALSPEGTLCSSGSESWAPFPGSPAASLIELWAAGLFFNTISQKPQDGKTAK